MGGLFGSKSAKAPKPSPPVRLVSRKDKEQIIANEQRLDRTRNRSGRRSTMLTNEIASRAGSSVGSHGKAGG